MKNLLILDLDETLIFSTEKKLDYENDFNADGYYTYKRPYLDEFLEEVFKHFKVAVWTSAGELYAKQIIDNVLTEDQKLEFLFSSDRCTLKFDRENQTYYNVKKLSKLKKRYNLRNILIVDDTPIKASYNYGNYIRVNPFEGDEKDEELRFLKDYVISFKDCDNVRNIEKRNWKERYER
jgi:TFIIF-interacting CTD phosphatase-like protein